MGVFSDLDTRIKELAYQNDIATVLDDRLDAINEDSTNNYPMLLYRVVRESSTTYAKEQETINIEVDFFLSDLYFEGNTNTLAQMRDLLVSKMDATIKGIRSTTLGFFVANNSNAEYAWEQHNDNLFILKRTATIQANRLSC